MTDPGMDRTTEIERLAVLDSINYEVVRRAEAKRLGIRSEILDQEVAKARRALGLERNEDDLGQGRAVKIPDILPWADAIEGDRVATGLASALKRYVVLSDAAADAVALWILHTWLVDKFTITPRLAITSPTKGCGKTTVLRFLNQVVRRPKRSGSISLAALFRVIELFHPTVILDETEKYIEHGGELHALLNEGHCKGGTVLRVLGDNQELREFSVFAAVAFAANGRLPDDLEQRAIVIEMQRRRADEAVAELREDRCEPLQNLARMCARWADDVADLIRDHDPDMGGLFNRVADNWRPLFAIADMIGDDWPSRAREAAANLMPRETESIGPMLLEDIKAAFEAKSTDRLSSEEICEALAAIEGRPWAEYGKAGKAISKNQLAKSLKHFRIVPDSVRIGDSFRRRGTAICLSPRQKPLPKRNAPTTPMKCGLPVLFKVQQRNLVAFPKRNRKSMLRSKNARNPCQMGIVALLRMKTPKRRLWRDVTTAASPEIWPRSATAI